MTGRILSRQPDDPGIDPINPHAPVIFKPSQLGRETAWLGAIMIGEIAPCFGGRMQKASLTIYLPGAPRKFLPSSSIERARRKLSEQAREWIDAAGLRA